MRGHCQTGAQQAAAGLACSHVCNALPPGCPLVRPAACLSTHEGAGEDKKKQPLPTRHRITSVPGQDRKAQLRSLCCSVRPAPRWAQPRAVAGLTRALVGTCAARSCTPRTRGV